MSVYESFSLNSTNPCALLVSTQNATPKFEVVSNYDPGEHAKLKTILATRYTTHPPDDRGLGYWLVENTRSNEIQSQTFVPISKCHIRQYETDREMTTAMQPVTTRGNSVGPAYGWDAIERRQATHLANDPKAAAVQWEEDWESGLRSMQSHGQEAAGISTSVYLRNKDKLLAETSVPEEDGQAKE